MLRKFAFGLTCLASVGLASGQLAAQDDSAAKDPSEKSAVMTIGSKAPAIEVEHWVSDAHGKFKPITEFDKGKVYVVEFWATWCGPCIASMPHLAETQEKYLDQDVQLISVSDEDLGTVEKFLNREYKPRNSDKDDESANAQDLPKTYGELTSAYCLTTDPDESVYQDYMRAAGQNGIPTAFIVGKSGVVEWIGHPMRMDEPLASVVDDSWDRNAFAAEFKLKQKRDLMISRISRLIRSSKPEETLEAISDAREEFSGDETVLSTLDQMKAYVVMQPIQTKIRGGENKEALALIEKMFPESDDVMQNQLLSMKLDLQLKESEFDAAAETLATIASQDGAEANALNTVAWQIYEAVEGSDDVPKKLVATAISAAEKALEQDAESPFVLDTLAHLQYVAGDLDAAIKTQSKAAANVGNDTQGIKKFLKKLRAEKADDK